MKRIVLIVYLFALWLLLTWNFHWQSLVTGGMASIGVGFVFGSLFVEHPQKIFQLKRWFWALLYIPVFTWEMAKANFDVAYRVLWLPKLKIKPGIVKVKTRLQSEMGKAFLANSITLTPGTFTIDIKDEYLYIHCINVKHEKIDEATHDIIDRFEKLLIKIFD